MARRLALLALLVASCDPFHTDAGGVAYYRRRELVPAPLSAPDTITVLNWNVKFGGGRIDFFFDCHGDRTNMSEGEVVANLERVAEKINQVDPDVLILQEVDVQSKRSAYVDQLQWLLDHTRMNYAVYASQWRADFVPSDGIGRVDSGNAILSRWPIEDAERIALPLIGENDALTNYFYLKRNILVGRVPLLDLTVLGVHAEAFSHDGTKKKHIDRFHEELTRLDAAGERFVAGGDLNTVPPGSVQVKDFADAACEDEDPRFDAEDYSGDAGWLDELYAAWEPEMPVGVYMTNNAPWFSFTSDANGFWNRKLDYLWTNGDFVDGSGLVHQDAAHGGLETMSRSDHAPVSVELDL